MSGFEVAGIVLGALPIVISAISAYKQKRGLLPSLIKSRGLLDDLLHELRNHQRNFYFDILDLLREAEVPEILVAEDPPQEECVKILQDSRTGIQVENYMGHVFRDFLDILTNYEEYLKKIASNLNHIVRPANVSFERALRTELTILTLAFRYRKMILQQLSMQARQSLVQCLSK